jgi:hypothetical protein
VRMKYSEDDLELDCEVFLSETEDINNNWLGDFVLVTKREENQRSLKRHNEVLSSFNTHTKSIRLLNCINSALQIELENAVLLSVDSLQSGENNKNITDENRLWSLSNLPVTRSVNNIPNIDTMIAKNDKPEEVMRQLKKDIERDTLLINGLRVCGAQVGLSDALKQVGAIVGQLMSECSLPALPSTMSDTLSKVILNKASRTHAGGITFQALQSMIDANTQMLIPQSSSAVPLNVQIAIGAFPTVFDANIHHNHNNNNSRNSDNIDIIADYVAVNHRLKYWGVVCCIECESVFHVNNRDTPTLNFNSDCDEVVSPSSTPDRTIATNNSSNNNNNSSSSYVKVVYTDFVLLDLKLSEAEMTNTDNIISDSKRLGTVTLSYQ